MKDIARKLSSLGDSGLVGIGTLVVFTSLVTVSSAAAGILINSSQSLGTQAEATMNETVSDISTGVKIVSVIGFSPGNGRIDTIEMLVKPHPGSQTIRLDNAVIQERWDTGRGTGVTQRTYVSPGEYENYMASPVDENGLHRTFTVYGIQDMENNGPTTLDVSGDLSKIVIDLAGDPGTNDEAFIEVIPEKGFNTFHRLLIPPLPKNSRYSSNPKPVEL